MADEQTTPLTPFERDLIGAAKEAADHAQKATAAEKIASGLQDAIDGRVTIHRPAPATDRSAIPYNVKRLGRRA